MKAGEPYLFLPGEAEIETRLSKLVAVIGPTVPHPAGPCAAERIFRGQEQHPTAGSHDPDQLLKTVSCVGKVLQHVAACHAIEGVVRKRQLGQIGDDVLRQIALDPVSGTPEHLVRQVETDELGVGVGVLDKMLGYLAGSASHVEDPFCSAQIETARPKQTLAERGVKRKKAARREDRSLRTIVDIADLIAILLVTDLFNQPTFEDTVDHFSLRRFLTWAFFFAASRGKVDHQENFLREMWDSDLQPGVVKDRCRPNVSLYPILSRAPAFGGHWVRGISDSERNPIL